MIIDFHSHNFPDAIAPRAIGAMCKMTAGVLWAAADGSLGNHLDNMDYAGVDRAVICHIATKPDQWHFIHRRAQAIMNGEFGERARRKLIPFGSIHPLDADFAAHLEEFAAIGVRGIKFHPYYQDFSLQDATYWPIFRKIAELGLTVVCHAGGDIGWKNARGLCGPAQITALIKAVPDLQFVAAHLGGCFRYPPGAIDRLLELGIYADTSVLHARWNYDEEIRLLRSWPTDRLLFGSDFPWTYYPESIAFVRRWRNSDDWPAIFADNARRLLKI